MSLDTEEVAEYTDVEQSDLEYEQEGSSQSDDSIADWKVEDASDTSNNRVFYTDDFTAELHRAAVNGIPDIQGAETNWPFASALDIPVIKQEREENDWVEHDEVLDEETGNEESEDDTVNPLCRFTGIPDIDVSNQDSEEVYDHSWTGM